MNINHDTDRDRLEVLHGEMEHTQYELHEAIKLLSARCDRNDEQIGYLKARVRQVEKQSGK